ncbi:hypothetical protein NPIL_31571, partial [Nephila pilipes]
LCAAGMASKRRHGLCGEVAAAQRFGSGSGAWRRKGS